MAQLRSNLSVDDSYSTAEALLSVLLQLARSSAQTEGADSSAMWNGMADIVEQVIGHVEALHDQAVEEANRLYALTGVPQ
jgi:hypothetical protein